MEPVMIFRHSEPSKLDTANFGAICKVHSIENNNYNYYIQLSRDCENPNWEKMESIIDEEDALKRRENLLQVRK